MSAPCTKQIRSHIYCELISYYIQCGKHCRPPTTLLTQFLYPYRNFEFWSQRHKLVYFYCCSVYNTKSHTIIKKIESYQLREGTEASEDGRSSERVRVGSRAGRRLVAGIRSGRGSASRSMRTKYHMCLPAIRCRGWTCVRELRHSSGRGIERCSSFCRLQNSSRMVEHLRSIQIVIKIL